MRNRVKIQSKVLALVLVGGLLACQETDLPPDIAPATPGGLSVEQTDNDAILTWVAVADVTGYRVRRNDEVLLETDSVHAPVVVEDGEYTVSAINGDAESARSGPFPIIHDFEVRFCVDTRIHTANGQQLEALGEIHWETNAPADTQMQYLWDGHQMACEAATPVTRHVIYSLSQCIGAPLDSNDWLTEVGSGVPIVRPSPVPIQIQSRDANGALGAAKFRAVTVSGLACTRIA